MPAKLIYAGVDYLRLTAQDHGPMEAWRLLCAPEYERERQAGRKQHMRWVLGYWGQVGEHCFVGERDDGCMIQLSGAYAWENWYRAGNHSNKCTRIDVQVTAPVDDEPGLYIRDMYRQGQLSPKREGKAPGLTLTDTPQGAKMLTVGSRQSLVYGRMYDKGRESGMPEYEGCVRWEIEVKAETAIDLNAHLRESGPKGLQSCAIVHNWWAQRGMAPSWEPFGTEGERPPMKRSKTDETKLAWLLEQVAPSVKVLTEHGRIKEAIRAVLSEALTEEQIEAMLATLREDVGS